jgi:hypothetical protein
MCACSSTDDEKTRSLLRFFVGTRVFPRDL